jgi:hypothetical protein
MPAVWPPAPNSPSKPVAFYDYTDEDGTVLSQNVRYEPKDFRQRRPARPDDLPDKVKGGWVWTTKGVRQVPYRVRDVIEAIRNGRRIFIVEGEKDIESLRAFAITSRTRSEALADIPAVGEFVPGYEATSVYGLGGPKNMPAAIVDRLNKEINAGLADPKIKARLADLGGDVFALSPADFGNLFADETEKWAKVIRAANMAKRDASRSSITCTREFVRLRTGS